MASLCRLSRALVLGLCLLVLPVRAEEAPDDFGRWERDVRQCQLGLSLGRAPTQRCEAVRLDQQLPGLLSVRFLSRSQGPSPTRRLLVFAGILERGSPPMACQAGSCRWSKTMRSRVSVLADLGIAERDGPSALPTTRLAQGSCLIQATRIRCEARMEGEGLWWAQADL